MEQENVAAGRIGAWFEYKGLNANSASQKMGYTNASKMYKILQGTNPGFETLVEFLTVWPDLSADWLLLGAGPMVRGQQIAAAPSAGRAIAAGKLPAVNNGQVLAITVDWEGNENTELVPVQAQAGYSLQHNEAVYLQDLPKYRIPGFEHGTYRAFEVAGDSMEPTLNHRDIVVASYVDNWRLLEPGDVYVVVTAESVMLKRIRERITAHDMTVMLYSDNHHRKPYPMDCADIAELWRVRGYISTYIPSTPDITAERLWEVIEALGFDKNTVRQHLEETAPNSAPTLRK